MDQDYQGPPVPPPELVQEWVAEVAPWTSSRTTSAVPSQLRHLATQAARWSADMELEACCKWMIKRGMSLDSSDLRTARRPKPSSLKEQALEVLMKADGADHPVPVLVLPLDEAAVIRRALEELPD